MNPKPFSALNQRTVPSAPPVVPTLGPGRAPRAPERGHRLRLRPALSGAGGVLDPLPLVEGAEAALVGDRREVHEDVLAAVVGLDEPEPLLRVEPLDRALRHAPT
jgi:hypothetical protein